MKSFFLLVVSMVMLVGCGSKSPLKDPFGAYAARMTVAQYERDARIAEAENAAWAKVTTARTWANTMPLVAVIAGVSTAAVVYIRWNGRITLERVRRGQVSPSRRQRPAPMLADLNAIAAKRNQRVKVVNGVALLVDNASGTIVKQRRLLEK